MLINVTIIIYSNKFDENATMYIERGVLMQDLSGR